MDNITLAAAKSFTKEALEGMGSIKGKDGFSPIIKENTSNTQDNYRLDITTENGTFTTDNLKGPQGKAGEKGETGDKGDAGSIPSNPSFTSLKAGNLSMSALSIGKDAVNNYFSRGCLQADSNVSGKCWSCHSGLEFQGCSGAVLPSESHVFLGDGSNPFYSMTSWSYAKPSDEKKKEILGFIEDNEAYEKLYDSLEFIYYRRNEVISDDPHWQAIQKPHTRSHFGVGAQTTERKVLEAGLTNEDFAAVKGDLFCSYSNRHNKIYGGWGKYKELTKEDGTTITADYTENVYNYKHRNEEGYEYQVINEILEVDVEQLNIDPNRANIGYIHIEDNSKLKSTTPPPLKINSIILVDDNDEYYPLDLSGENILYYEEGSNVPLSSVSYSDDGSITMNTDTMYGAVAIKVDTFNINDYKKIIIDADYIGEYNIVLLPKCHLTNAYLWDRTANDQILFDYLFDYEELFNLSAAILQKTRKDFKVYKEQTQQTINDLLSRVSVLENKIN